MTIMPSRPAPPGGRVHPRAVPLSHWPYQGRDAWRRGAPKGRSHHRGVPQAARLSVRTVRQKPSRGQGKFLPTSRVRRILRQPLSPQRRGGTGEPGLSQGSGVQEKIRPARRAPFLCEDLRRSDGRSGLRTRSARESRNRPAHQEAHGDGRRGNPRRGERFHASVRSGNKPFFCWFNSTRMHVFTHVPPGRKNGRRACTAEPTAWSSTTPGRRSAQGAR